MNNAITGITDKTAAQVQPKDGQMCYIFDKYGQKKMVTFSHIDPNGKLYLNHIGVKLPSGRNKTSRKAPKDVYIINSEGLTPATTYRPSNAITTPEQEQQDKEAQERAALAAKIKAGFSITKRFSILESLTRLVALGARKSLVITGPAGMGKTYTVMQVVKELGLIETALPDTNLDPNVGQNHIEEEAQHATDTNDGDSADGDYIIIKGYSTPRGLYEALYENRDKLIIFDDTDSILKDKTALNILKAALDSYDKRIVSWNSSGSIGDTPKSFLFEGQIIFISNLSIGQMDRAVLTRSSKCDVSMSAKEKVEIMTYIVNTGGFMRDYNDGQGVPMHVLKECLEFIKPHAFMESISLRTLEEVVTYYMNDFDMWRDLAEYSIYS
jgi:hypothetical protein